MHNFFYKTPLKSSPFSKVSQNCDYLAETAKKKSYFDLLCELCDFARNKIRCFETVSSKGRAEQGCLKELTFFCLFELIEDLN